MTDSKETTTTLYENQYTITQINPDGKKFQTVARLVAQADNKQASELEFDIHREIYPLKLNDVIKLSLSTVANDVHEYVTYGQVFKVTEDAKESKKTVNISFGGLLMAITDTEARLNLVNPNQKLYAGITKM
jgi:DNA-directed RNA polymerase I, II, and III subunit RPABC3